MIFISETFKHFTHEVLLVICLVSYYTSVGLPTTHKTSITLYYNQRGTSAAFASELCETEVHSTLPFVNTTAKILLYDTLKDYVPDFASIVNGFWVNAFRHTDPYWYWDDYPKCTGMTTSSPMWSDNTHLVEENCAAFRESGLMSYHCASTLGIVVCERYSISDACDWNNGPSGSCFADTTSNVQTETSVSTLDACKQKCEEFVLQEYECWAIEYNDNAYECKIYFHANPLLLVYPEPNYTDCPDTEIHHRQCFDSVDSSSTFASDYCDGACSLHKTCSGPLMTTSEVPATETPKTLKTNPSTTTTSSPSLTTSETPVTTSTTPPTTPTVSSITSGTPVTTSMVPPTTPSVLTTSETPVTTSTVPPTTQTTIPPTTPSVSSTTSETPVTTSMVPPTTPSVSTTTSETPVTTSTVPPTTQIVSSTTSETPDTTFTVPPTISSVSTSTSETPFTTSTDPLTTQTVSSTTSETPVTTSTVPPTTPSVSSTTSETPVTTSTPKHTPSGAIPRIYLWPCYCSSRNILSETNAEITERYVRELILDRTTTSSFVRSKTSAKDERISSRSIGITGSIVIGVIVVIVFLSDLIKP